MDPSDGVIEREPLGEFVGRWQAGDVCRTGATYRQWGIAAGVEW